MRSDITPGMHARRRAVWERIEQEFGEPFWDVVQGFADMGYGKSATARALGMNPSAFLRMLSQIGGHIRWPAYADQVVWKDHSTWDEGRRMRTSAGRRISGKRIRWVHVRGELITATDAAKIAGVSVSTICKRHHNGLRGDALIAPAMDARTRGILGKASQMRNGIGNKQHPWRAEA